MATDHSKTPMDVLKTTLNLLYSKKLDLELADPEANKVKIGNINAKIQEYGAIIEGRIEADEAKYDPSNSSLQVATQSTPANPLATSEAKFNYNSMVNHFKSNVPTLEPPLDVSIFLQRLQNCYNLYVKGFKALEPYFVQQAKSHLSMDILETLNASSEKTATFEELQLYLKKNYGSRETPYQILNSLLELEIKEGEKIQEFAGRVERKVATVTTQISAKFKSQESNTNDSPMTTADCFNLFGSMLVYDHLRKRQPNCFNLMVKEVDSCWKPTDLGSMAATLVDRMDIPDQSQAANQSFSARPNNKQQKSNQKSNKPAPTQGATSKSATFPNDICYLFLKKKSCRFASSCKRKHVSPGDNGYDQLMQMVNDGVRPKSKPRQTPNANVATAKPNHGEWQPEEVDMDYFDLNGYSKN